MFNRVDSNPVYLPVNAVASWLRSDASNAYHCVKLIVTYASHAAIYAKATAGVGVTDVGSLVDQNSQYVTSLSAQRLALRRTGALAQVHPTTAS